MKQSLTHTSGKELYTRSELSTELTLIKARLEKTWSDDEAMAATALNMLEELQAFELGRFLIKNAGALSGKWTYYIIVESREQQVTNKTEEFLLHRAPMVKATQERYDIFQRELHSAIKSNSIICSIPCGVMGDLLHLDLPEDIENVRFVGIDLDETAFELASALAKKLNVKHRCEFFKKDAWQMTDEEKYDVITTNGLNIYEKSDDRVQQLYKMLHRALKPDGLLLGSHLSMPTTPEATGEWDMSQINGADLSLQKLLFVDILQATWSNFRSAETTQSQLSAAGFKDINILWDTQKIFYTFTARK